MRIRRTVVVASSLFIGLLPAACGSDTDTSTGSSLLEPVPVTQIPGPYDYDFTIPAGTGELIDSGARPAVFPVSLDVSVGETIRIVNEDDRGHTMGTFYVLANSTLTYRFTKEGVYEGDCTVNPEMGFTLTVSA